MKAAVVCSVGIGDALIMMVASHHLLSFGYKVVTFQNYLDQMATFFPNHRFSNLSTDLDLDDFDIIILQNKTLPLYTNIIKRYREKTYIFYTGYEYKKHFPLTKMDYVFDKSKHMAYNVAKSISSILKTNNIDIDNGITIPNNFVYKKHKTRILIHPTGGSKQKIYSHSKFIKVAEELSKSGYEIIFCVSDRERKSWLPILKNRFSLPKFPTLEEFTKFVYESKLLIGNDSGPSHLASNLGIPTIVIASCPRNMSLWRPGFLTGKIITPARYIPNIKFFRLRQKMWISFISYKRIVRAVLS